ncbi:MAG: dTDP-4-dehydrorhamnose reductase [Phreatobacter sp.]|uniref:dTDP-4-dehydrorhamnose reductase n=1 Tax=Phreatobacter sp. TaxID=1966341 RepID=UPI001A476F7F|nr:dTDP-4-dehydrorhamnose reductase [Phreatobacter sp.]MBL8571942.1 dTDP-4-dehydrorhamnose reductase [Phreatobacter sp.]
MRLVVTGLTGQVVSALVELGADCADLVVLPVGRPQLDLAEPTDVEGVLRGLRPDAVVSAAAYTAVDRAETESDLAMQVNGTGAGAVAATAAALGVPVLHLSTDYVFDGANPAPYVETDPVAPMSAYGRSKLAGERAMAAAHPDHAILRTSWVYAAEGKNFLRTMLRLAADRPEVSVVADQQGAPSYAPDIAVAVVQVARNLLAESTRHNLRGVFHMSGGGETTWAGFAEEIFRQSAARGGPTATVRPISTADYPTPAARPANSRLDCTKLKAAHAVALPEWREALARCMDRLKEQGALTR